MTAGDFYFVPPHAMAIGWAGSGGADTSYDEDWLFDGRPGRPVRAATGTETWTGTGAAVTVSLAALCNHNLDAARDATVGGDVSATLTGPPLPPNGIPLNPWVSITPTSATTVTLAISGNSAPIVAGEFVIGTRHTLERAPAPGAEFTQQYGTVRHEAEFNSLMPYDKGVVSRTLKGDVVLTDTGLSAVQDWWDATRGNTRPSLIVPNANVQDAWLVEFVEFTYQPTSKNRNLVSLRFMEYPRSRW